MLVRSEVNTSVETVKGELESVIEVLESVRVSTLNVCVASGRVEVRVGREFQDVEPQVLAVSVR